MTTSSFKNLSSTFHADTISRVTEGAKLEGCREETGKALSKIRNSFDGKLPARVRFGDSSVIPDLQENRNIVLFAKARCI